MFKAALFIIAPNLTQPKCFSVVVEQTVVQPHHGIHPAIKMNHLVIQQPG